MDRLPNLFIPGFQKCATCTIFESLIQHHRVSGAKRWRDLNRLTFPKEVHYFDKHYDRGLDFLASLYEGAEEDYLIDGSPNYIADPGAFERILVAVPEARFIVSMRNPVDRTISAWNHRSQLEPHEKWSVPVPGGTLMDNIIADVAAKSSSPPGGGLLGLGCYASHIRKAVKLSSHDRFHFLFLEDLNVSFAGEIRKIFDFLELDPIALPNLHVHRRQHTADDLTTEAVEFLTDYYKDEDDKLSELLGVELPWRV